MLPEIRIASPCTANWEKMTGDARARHCAECKLDVYNFSAMTSHEIEQLLAASKGQRVCGRLYRRADGTILTSDCPVGFRPLVRRVSRIAGAALTAALSLGFAAAQTPQKGTALTQIAPAEAGLEVAVVDETGALIPKAKILIRDRNGMELTKGVTDSNGEFRAPIRTTGSYVLNVQAAGFRTHSDTVSIREHETVSLRVVMSVGHADMMLGEIVAILVEPTTSTVPDLLPVPADEPSASAMPFTTGNKNPAPKPQQK